MRMLLSYRNNISSLSGRNPRNLKHATTDRSSVRCCVNFSVEAEGSLARIKEIFGRKIELSVSAYDTAWVAMVPSRDIPNKPRFPQCLDWIMDNQHQDGSWGLRPRHPSLVKDYLSCTLACVLALRKWKIGERLVQSGLKYIESHCWGATDKDQLYPIGFDIVFPRMIKEAIELGLDIPLDKFLVDHMISHRDSVIESFRGREAVLAYVGEGLEGSFFCEELMRNQHRSNGSLVNSPATTASALIHHDDDRNLEYLLSALNQYKIGVPTLYPTDVYVHLHIVDALQRLGIERHVRSEAESILNDAYRHWQLKSEVIFLDVTCCALAFRLLRSNGYEVSSDELAKFSDQEEFFSRISMQFTGLTTILELHRASQWMVHQNEGTLEKIHTWTRTYLKQQLDHKNISDKRLRMEVEYALKNMTGTLERVQTRQNIDLYKEENFQILKTSYRCPDFVNNDLLTFSIHDFGICQARQRAELQQLERWYKENRLDTIKDCRHVLLTAYFLIAADLSNPGTSEARTSYAQSICFVTFADDLFDKYGSREELLNVIDLVKKWDEPLPGDYCSDQVKTFYLAFYKTINELAAKAFSKQGRCSKNHIISLWVDMMEAMMREVDWWEDGVTPTMEEYMSVACVTVACKVCIFSALYLLGLKLPEEIICSEEMSSLFKQVATTARLLNDLQTYKKESDERKPNSVSLQLVQGVTEQEAIKKVKGMIEISRKELLRMVLQKKGSKVPKVCKEVFWTTSKIAHFLYSYRDEFSSPKQMIHDINAVIFEPANFPPNFGP